jgi:hypothetical protein
MSLFYFSYAANMDMEDLTHRCDMRRRNRAQFISTTSATLAGYRLVTNVFCPHRESGILNLAPDSRGIVEGVLYELPAGDVVSTKDLAEGEPNTFRIHTVTVRTRRGKDVPANVLIAAVRGQSMYGLCDSYKTVVVNAARRHKLSASWIERLVALPRVAEGSSARQSAFSTRPVSPKKQSRSAD